MSKLIENIINGNLSEANEMMSDRLSVIKEQKLYEKKRSIQLAELGPFNYKQRFADLKAKGAKRASDVWGDDAKKKKAEADAETPQRRKRAPGAATPKATPSEPKGNSPSAMYQRAKAHVAAKTKEVMDKKQAAPGSAVVNTAKATGRGAAGLGKLALKGLAGFMSGL